MQQALCEVTMVPVMDTTDPAKVIACMVLIGICNSDYYFPSYISSKATNGFLVLTVDGVHVSTKSTEGEDRSWIVGHKADSITSSQAADGTYSGKIFLRGIPHLFIDHPLKNYSGDLVGYISFGLQEDQFSGIVEDNRKQTMVIGADLADGFPGKAEPEASRTACAAPYQGSGIRSGRTETAERNEKPFPF